MSTAARRGADRRRGGVPGVLLDGGARSAGPVTRQPGLDDVLDALDEVLPLSSALATTLLLVGLGRRRQHPAPVLARATAVVLDSFRHDDWLGRPSAEQVVAVLNGTADDAQSVAARVLDRVDAAGCGLRVVVGVVELRADLTAQEALDHAADAVTVARVLRTRRVVHHRLPRGAPAEPPAGRRTAGAPRPAGLDVLLPPAAVPAPRRPARSAPARVTPAPG
ncbi:hypothetical protein GB931_03255 [Modestobacter sp. I12A-02628]|uniref:GGDEF domain-containing protein n=1 Tax=Goekera deserti TaxID=2497753 RepID=A0A7K3WEG8_9ACTN|nr:hypothetical protein [Goekera deserti]MPQ96955.1 hypothetical protein [Goekera deserti]NDI46730.1 hypothetical protein [Goekera deserti]NEL54299.1 hypothetical protein [Goekera deserti]